MNLKLTIEFKCQKCGLLSPGLLEIPNGTSPDLRIQAVHKCFHCDKPLDRIATVREFMREDQNAVRAFVAQSAEKALP